SVLDNGFLEIRDVVRLACLEYLTKLNSARATLGMVSEYSELEGGLQYLSYLHLWQCDIEELDLSPAKRLRNLSMYGGSTRRIFGLSSLTQLRSVVIRSSDIDDSAIT